jgi:putative oxidoreductase
MIILGKFQPYIYAIFRIVVGFLFMTHGIQKIFGVPASQYPRPELASLPGVAGIIELVCGALILVGFFASPAAFLASGMMAVAYFMAHQAGGVLPIQNGGELAAVYSFVFLFISAYGSGTWSVDSILKKEAE